jgi:hypothetical protein
VVDKRMSDSQQMRWDPPDAHPFRQGRARVIDGLLRNDFERWHPAFTANAPSLEIAA